MNNYTFFEKKLHRQFLGQTSISRFLYERILSNSENNNNSKIRKNIFVTGLARSGTTALLNKLYSSNEFSSLLYKYMPFILSPKLAYSFSKLRNSKDLESVKRYHNDGINININSPECLDEIFWVKASLYKSENKFNNALLSKKLLKGYSYLLNAYSSLDNNKILLVKNNNNHKRIISLANYFQSSIFLFMFRDPLCHSNSLLSQHKNFLKLQEETPFILEYMNLLGHNEFGKDAKPFIYHDEENNLIEKNKLDLDYWLNQWINTYSWVLNNQIYNFKNVKLISYEVLCKKKSLYKKICKLIGNKNYNSGTNFKLANKKSANYKIKNKYLLEYATDIYKELLNNSFI